MKESITGLEEAEWWARSYLTAAAATAVRDPGPWTYSLPRGLLRRRESVTFPHPWAVTAPDAAQRWAALAEDLAAEIKRSATGAVLQVGLLLSLVVLPFGVTISGILARSWNSSAFFGASVLALIVAGAALVAMAVVLRTPMNLAPVWERRAMALRARAHELAAADVDWCAKTERGHRRGWSRSRSRR